MEEGVNLFKMKREKSISKIVLKLYIYYMYTLLTKWKSPTENMEKKHGKKTITIYTPEIL